MTFNLPKLPYPYDALEPHIDAKTMEIHYTKHHAGYYKRLNEVVENTEFKLMKIEAILKLGAKALPEQVRNYAGGAANHDFFWKSLRPVGMPANQPGKLVDAIGSTFGSLEGFKDKMATLAAGVFGSGWAWLVLNDGKLELIATHNQDSPLMEKKIPILGLDVWEHAYYLKYQNKRADYFSNWWKVINWDFAEECFNSNR